MRKLKPRPLGIELDVHVAETLKSFVETPYFDSLMVLMRAYINLQKDIAWRLNEASDDFSIRHAQLTGAAKAMYELQDYLLKVGKRESREDGQLS